eukprot:scaffold2200_cov413-Prasinococcus_capsulatus_cf.AAC.28
MGVASILQGLNNVLSRADACGPPPHEAQDQPNGGISERESDESRQATPTPPENGNTDPRHAPGSLDAAPSIPAKGLQDAEEDGTCSGPSARCVTSPPSASNADPGRQARARTEHPAAIPREATLNPAPGLAAEAEAGSQSEGRKTELPFPASEGAVLSVPSGGLERSDAPGQFVGAVGEGPGRDADVPAHGDGGAHDSDARLGTRIAATGHVAMFGAGGAVRANGEQSALVKAHTDMGPTGQLNEPTYDDEPLSILPTIKTSPQFMQALSVGGHAGKRATS